MMMIDRAAFFGFISATLTLVFVLDLVRRRKLREEYSLLWMGTAVALLLLGSSRPALDTLASLMGIAYPPSALFLVAIVFVLFLLLHFSTVLTRLSQENKAIAQELALLRQQLVEATTALEQHDANPGK